MTTKLTPAQARRVEQALPRLERLARHIAAQVAHSSYDDLFGAGQEGLVQAALRYEPDSGIPFGAYAHHRMRGAMIDAARRAAPQIRRHKRALRSLEATQALLEEAETRQPSPDVPDPRTLAERVAAAADLVDQATTAVLLARDAPPDVERVPIDRSGAEIKLLRAERHRLLYEALERLSAEDRALYHALYVEGLSMHEYAMQTGRSVSSVSRRHARVVRDLGTRLKARYRR